MSARLDDPFCYPLHVRQNGLSLVQLDSTSFHDEPFHDHRLDGRYPDAGTLPFKPLLEHVRARTLPRPNYVFHHAFSLSTLVTRWLDVPGSALCYREPLVLTQLSQLEHEKPGLLAREDGAAVLELTVGLLRRVERPSEGALIKGCDSLTNIIPQLMAQHPEARGVLLYTDLDAFVISCLKASSRRAWARDRALAFQRWPGAEAQRERDVSALDDAEAVAFLWLLQMQAYSRLLAQLPGRLHALYAESLLQQPAASLSGLAELFGFGPLSAEVVNARLNQPHAKTGEQYDAAQRAAELREHARQLSGDLARARRFFVENAGEIVLGDERVTAESRS
jgi:hypothetical protein